MNTKNVLPVGGHSFDKALVRWAFQSLPEACAMDLLEIAVREREPNSTQGVWFHNSATIIEKQFTDAALGRLPFVSPHLLPDARLLAASPRGGGINGLGPMSGLVPNLP